MIFDPVSERAYCKDFVVNQNMREQIFPEYSGKDMTHKTKETANVWRFWLEDL